MKWRAVNSNFSFQRKRSSLGAMLAIEMSVGCMIELAWMRGSIRMQAVCSRRSPYVGNAIIGRPTHLRLATQE